ncbi:MAG: hypothetical protein J5705_06955 [Bacteroidaceae bacterium]|nr:hypothetical protein [Bacteroidaceae bacterium]
MSKIDIEKLKELSNADDLLSEKYGEEGSASRQEFEAEAKEWYYSELSKDELTK